MTEDQKHRRWPASATPGPVDRPHDSWKERYRPDPWSDQMLVSLTAALPVMLTNKARTIFFLNNTKREVDSFVRGCRTFDAQSCFLWGVLPTAESVIEVD